MPVVFFPHFICFCIYKNNNITYNCIKGITRVYIINKIISFLFLLITLIIYYLLLNLHSRNKIMNKSEEKLNGDLHLNFKL